jgi:UDP-glucose 4-epimerase
MILITGGLGFIGLHTARALLDLGESCVLTRYRMNREPALLTGFLSSEIGSRAFVEPLDITDRRAFLDFGTRYKITGIVHLAESGVGVPSLTEDVPLSAAPLMNVIHAADRWEVPRVSVASAIGVYIGAGDSPLREDLPLPMTATHPIELMKKTSELLSSFLAGQAGFEVVTHRITATYGPLYRNLTSNLGVAARLVHAAVKGEAPQFSPRFQPYADDGADWCYAADCGRAIALLHTTPRLEHRVYNVGTGRPTTNRQFVEAIKRVIPEFPDGLPGGHDPNGPGQALYLDTTRLRSETGFVPEYDVERGIAGYIDWLRSGNQH